MRTHYCGEISEDLIGKQVDVCGWVNRRRDHGGVIFVDLRDREGLVQLVFDPDTPEVFAVAERVRNEFVLRVHGTVRYRPKETENPDLKTGKVEIVGQELEILNPSETPPFQLDEEDVKEEVRLRYRYIDIRRPEMLKRLRLRSTITRHIRTYLDDHGFLDVETPMLTRATPEGARDYLVPSRTHHGQFFALPQSPQLFKQLLMVSGIDRYYQIVRCFRDEDLRADRQPEFTQLDIETSFLNEDQIMNLMEEMIRSLFTEVLEERLPDPFPRMTYTQAMKSYGTDRPDLRNPLQIVDLVDLMKGVEFKVFAQPANDTDSRVVALRVPQGCKLSRKEIDDYTDFVSVYGAKGLAYIRINDFSKGRDGLQSPIVKFLPDEVVEAVMRRTAAQDGDLIFFGADKATIVNESLGALREKLAADLGLTNAGWCPLWVVEFPMFEWDPTDKRWVSLHHPFTSPKQEHIELLETQPQACHSRAYDLVLNGTEVGGGSIRINRRSVQEKVFAMLGIDAAEANEKFGFLLKALRFGCPPHGGIAFGLDRLVMLMASVNSIRDVMAFPKTQTANCLLTEAPTEVSETQLRELSIRVRKPRSGGEST